MKTKREIPDKYEECGISIYKFLKNNQHGYWAFKIVDFDTGDFCRDIGREVRKHFQPVSEGRVEKIAKEYSNKFIDQERKYYQSEGFAKLPEPIDYIRQALRELGGV